MRPSSPVHPRGFCGKPGEGKKTCGGIAPIPHSSTERVPGGSWHGGAAGSPPRPSGFHSFLPKVGSDRGCPRGRAEQLKAEGPKNSLSGRPAWNGAAAARRCQFSWLFAPRVGLFVVCFLAVLRNARGTGTASKPSRDRGKRGELEALWLLPPTAGAASRSTHSRCLVSAAAPDVLGTHCLAALGPLEQQMHLPAPANLPALSWLLFLLGCFPCCI